MQMTQYNVTSNRKQNTYVQLKRGVYQSPIMSIFVLSLGLLSSGCQKAEPVNETVEISSQRSTSELATYENKQLAKAREIAKKHLVTDTHIDVPDRLVGKYEDISKHTEHGDFDFPRAVEGGLDAPFMSIYIPASLEKTGGSKALADKLITMVEGIVKDAPSKFALAYSTADIETNFSKGIVSLPMGMENGSPIEGDITNLKHFYDRGIRYITLAHSKSNHISDSSYDTDRPAGGLTDFGKELIVEMNNLGVMVDVSHISDKAFYDVVAITKVPVIASHSSARYFTAGFERNMNDEMIQALAKNGGVIQINFGSLFITQAAQDYSATKQLAFKAFMKHHSVTEDSEIFLAFKEQYKVNHPYPYARLSEVLDHFDHVVKLVGIDYVGIGSDYDGVGDSLPENLKDVASYPNLIAGLLTRGYSEQDIIKILSGNVMRVWKAAEAYADKH